MEVNRINLQKSNRLQLAGSATHINQERGGNSSRTINSHVSTYEYVKSNQELDSEEQLFIQKIYW